MKLLLPLLIPLLVPVLLCAQDDTTATPQWRPLYHFTPARNWTNDPNGLIYRDGVYHLYNQQNPFANHWGHMSWGHATSTDLVYWQHLPIALPETIDKDTTWRYSGCAVWDSNNTSGFCKTGGCMVAVYTADQPNLQKESQFVAYSNDDGNSFINYEKNPVIDLHKKDFRDPSVSWNTQLKTWLMVVALPAEHKILFYTSPNLKDWAQLTEFGPAGYTSANWECPSFMQLPVDGTTAKKKWVLAVSAAGAERGVFMQYFVGSFDGKTFSNDNPDSLVLPVDEGDCFYAAIPWNNQPADKNIFLGWLVPGPQATYPWRGQMSVPRDLSLRQTAAGLRLVQHPSSVIENKLPILSNNKIISLRDLTIEHAEKELYAAGQTNGNAYWVDAVFATSGGTDIGFIIGQQKDAGKKTLAGTLIGYNAATGKVYIDKTNAGGGKLDKNKILLTTTIAKPASTIRLQVLFDKSSLEVFVNDGEKLISTQLFPAKGATGLSVFSKTGSATIKSLKVWNLAELEN